MCVLTLPLASSVSSTLLLTIQPYVAVGLLRQIIRGLLPLTSWIKFLSFSFLKSLTTLSLHLFLGHPAVLIPLGFQSVILLTSFIPSILL